MTNDSLVYSDNFGYSSYFVNVIQESCTWNSVDVDIVCAVSSMFD